MNAPKSAIDDILARHDAFFASLQDAEKLHRVSVRLVRVAQNIAMAHAAIKAGDLREAVGGLISAEREARRIADGCAAQSDAVPVDSAMDMTRRAAIAVIDQPGAVHAAGCRS
jgi:hypothetical protein